MNETKDNELQQLLDMKKSCDDIIRKLSKFTPEDVKEDKNKTDLSPVFDLYLCGKYLYLDLELPGVIESAIKIKNDPPYFRISGKFPELEDVMEENFFVKMRRTGAFNYKFATPKGTKIKNYSSKMLCGVLHLKIELIELEKVDDANALSVL